MDNNVNLLWDDRLFNNSLNKYLTQSLMLDYAQVIPTETLKKRKQQRTEMPIDIRIDDLKFHTY